MGTNPCAHAPPPAGPAPQGATKALQSAGWDGVLLGGNYMYGERSAGRPLAATVICIGAAASFRCRLTHRPCPASGVALGKCVESGYSFASDVAAALKKAIVA